MLRDRTQADGQAVEELAEEFRQFPLLLKTAADLDPSIERIGELAEASCRFVR